MRLKTANAILIKTNQLKNISIRWFDCQNFTSKSQIKIPTKAIKKFENGQASETKSSSFKGFL